MISAGYTADNTDENNIKDHYTLGQIYYEHGLYDKAQDEFQKALDAAQAGKDMKSTISPSSRDSIPTPENISNNDEYLIDIADTLRITVWENPDMTQDVIVRPDGKISFPLVGDVYAKNKTVSQLAHAIADKIEEYIRFPQVNVSLTQIGGNKIIIMGEVSRPGRYSIADAPTVITAIASAGGFNRDAIQNSIIVISGGLKNPVPRRVNVQDAIRKGIMGDNNIALKPNDIIFVPKKFIADMNYFMMKILEPLTSGTGTESTFKSY